MSNLRARIRQAVQEGNERLQREGCRAGATRDREILAGTQAYAAARRWAQELVIPKLQLVAEELRGDSTINIDTPHEGVWSVCLQCGELSITCETAVAGIEIQVMFRGTNHGRTFPADTTGGDVSEWMDDAIVATARNASTRFKIHQPSTADAFESKQERF